MVGHQGAGVDSICRETFRRWTPSRKFDASEIETRNLERVSLSVLGAQIEPFQGSEKYRYIQAVCAYLAAPRKVHFVQLAFLRIWNHRQYAGPI
jgi:hypothetical protein